MKWTHWILYGICAPWDFFVAWPIVIAIRILWGKELRWERPPAYTREHGGGGGPCLVCQMKEGSFPVRKGRWPVGWYLRDRKSLNPRPWGGTTLGHAIFYGSTAVLSRGWTRLRAHEHVHVEQAEVAMLQSFIAGAAGGVTLLALGHFLAALVFFLILWASGYLMMGAAGWLTAFLRGEEAYWGATHEESARAQDDHLVEK